jgi:hypothetical protein
LEVKVKFDNETDFAEWIATTHGIIKAFEDRGYALYELGPGPVMPALQSINIISMKRPLITARLAHQ